MTKKFNHIPKTNWYKGTQKPVRSGVYQRLYVGVEQPMFCWFDVKAGVFGKCSANPEVAKDMYGFLGESDIQNLAWCGLSRDPAEVAQ